MTRNSVIAEAVDKCLEELFSEAQPSVTWEDFKQQCSEYYKKYREWEELYKSDNSIPLLDYCGPKPYEFYYLPKDVFKSIADSYVSAYELDHQQNLLDTIEILKGYCKNPIIDTYEPDEDGISHRGYAYPDNLEKEIVKILGDVAEDNEYYQHKLLDKFFEFLDMAGNFYSWNRDLNAFNIKVYLGASPTSNKEEVIKNWKQYRNKDIVIDESVYLDDEDTF